MDPKKNLLILGYGRLGAAFSRLYGKRYEIRGIRRSSSMSEDSPWVIPMPIQSESLMPHLEWADIIVFSPAPGSRDIAQYRETYLANMEFVLNRLKRRTSPLTLFILISSTGVYPRGMDGPWREGMTIPRETPHQEILLRTEQAVDLSGFPHVILRAGGLYGRKRGYLHRALMRGKIYTSEMSEQNVTSVHEDDLCGVIHRVIERGLTEIYNVVDDTCLTKREWGKRIADEIGLPIEPDTPPPPPPRGSHPSQGGAKPPNTLCSVTPQTSVLLRRPAGAVASEWPPPPASTKRIENEKLKTDLGYRFLYPTVLTFLEEIKKGGDGHGEATAPVGRCRSTDV